MAEILHASVSTFSSAVIISEDDKTNLKLKGGVSSTANAELGYLDLVWTFPTDTQIGDYDCKGVGITKLGRTITFSTTLTVDKSLIKLDDVVSELQNLKKIVKEQNATLTGQHGLIVNETAKNSILKSTVVKQQAVIDSLSKDNIQQQAELNSLKAEMKESKHIETGWIDCEHSNSWSTVAGTNKLYYNYHYFSQQKHKTASFRSAYLTPPVVFLSVSNFWVKEDKGTKYGIQLLDVNKHNFTIRCGTESSSYEIEDLEIRWMSIPV